MTIKQAEDLRRVVRAEVSRLRPGELESLLAFIRFLRRREPRDPAQAYFWTRRWQTWESAADRDKRAGHVLGDGTIQGAIRALHA